MNPHPSLELLFTEARQRRCCIRPSTPTERKALECRVRNGMAVRAYRGLYLPAGYWNGLDRHEQIRHIVRSLAIMHPDWIFCGPTAAIMHNLDCSYRLAMPICIVAGPNTHYTNTPQLVHYAIAHPEVDEIQGVRVTSLLRTLFDCAAKQTLRYSLGPLDSALRQNNISYDALSHYPKSVKYSRNRKAVERAFALADGRSENGGESEARGVFADINRPVTDIQTVFPCSSVPGRIHRTDFLWVRADGGKIAGELDGTRKYVDPTMTDRRTIQEVVDKERERQQCLGRQGVRMVRMYYDDLNTPTVLANRLDEVGVPIGGSARPTSLCFRPEPAI